MKHIYTKTLPLTQHRKHKVTVERCKLDNGLLVDIVVAPGSIATVTASTQILRHDSVEAAKAFLSELEKRTVYAGKRLDFFAVRNFANHYKAA